MKIREIENKAWSMDGIRIVIRGNENEDLGEYTQKNAAQANWSVTKYLDTRIKPLIGGHAAIVLMGDGEQPHGRTLLSSVRDSYSHS
ncbi:MULTISPECIES: hypothetical protein [unclassified Ectothiorhodospira]|uniref:hypothetical protein n=1 Tax=unclassified Ectothiorhodospira TaxID=2684909 RepID=UPI001EE7EC23|nr:MULTISPECIES: hypothetical protein [unclassified Ectothiorhodospira]MCG5517430.1 hypothetical protein [Ectothiorhodospira sp. 9100]MCG5520351.1 hypothetical protein [Ectothiorhodospira sp. 9905]